MDRQDDDMLDEGPLQCDLEEFGDGGPVTPLCPDRGGSALVCTRASIAAPNVEQPDRVKSVVLSIVRGLDSAHAPTVRVRGEVVEFRGCIFRAVLNWNPLAMVTKGRMSVSLEPGNVKVDYCLWYTDALFIAMVFSCFAGLCASATGSVIAVLGSAIGAFVFVFGINRLISESVFRTFLINCVRESESPGRC